MSIFFRRTAARSTDYLLWGILTVIVLKGKIGSLEAPSLLFYASFWIYTITEALLICLFGTTIGKRLFGVRILSPDGEKLSFFRSLKRAFLVFGLGTGFFLPYVSLILPVIFTVWLFVRRNLPKSDSGS